MTRDYIIRMAREAGLQLIEQDINRNDDRLVEILMPFAALVAAHERTEILTMLREQWFRDQESIEDAIRARGQA